MTLSVRSASRKPRSTVTEVERLKKLGADRRLIFENVANGVPMEGVRAAFQRSQTEVDRELTFVGRKIKEYRFRRHQPPVPCDTVQEMRWNRVVLLETLRKLGDEYMMSSLIIPNVGVQTLNDISTLREATRKVGLKTVGL